MLPRGRMTCCQRSEHSANGWHGFEWEWEKRNCNQRPYTFFLRTLFVKGLREMGTSWKEKMIEMYFCRNCNSIDSHRWAFYLSFLPLLKLSWSGVMVFFFFFFCQGRKIRLKSLKLPLPKTTEYINNRWNSNLGLKYQVHFSLQCHCFVPDSWVLQF